MTPREYLSMDIREKSFVIASIELKAEAERKEEGRIRNGRH